MIVIGLYLFPAAAALLLLTYGAQIFAISSLIAFFEGMIDPETLFVARTFLLGLALPFAGALLGSVFLAHAVNALLAALLF